MRDQALLLTTWCGALRQSSASNLDWGDLCDEGDDVRVLVRGAKGDLDGVGLEYWLTPSDDPSTCPVTAYRAYAAAVEREAGSHPGEFRRDEPFLVRVGREGQARLDGHGRLMGLSGEAVSQRIQTLAGRAGLDGARFVGHSMRSGFITEAPNTDGVTPAQVQSISGQQTPLRTVLVDHHPTKGELSTQRIDVTATQPDRLVPTGAEPGAEEHQRRVA
ncbi:MAG TPA: hypothetical protein VM097_04995, partial [Mycobacteriales bacterium]|nr:hypothetical protein [Mycobacteriales bacterium]